MPLSNAPLDLWTTFYVGINFLVTWRSVNRGSEKQIEGIFSRVIMDDGVRGDPSLECSSYPCVTKTHTKRTKRLYRGKPLS